MLGFAAVAIAAVWLYAIAVGGIAIIAGLLRLAVSHTRKQAAGHTHPHAQATFAPPASIDVEWVADVHPDATREPSSARQAAHQVFAAWTRGLPKAPRDPAALVRGITCSRRLIVRRDTWAEGRKLVWRVAPYKGPGRVSGPPVDVDTVDAWSAPPDLMARSTHVCSCAGCAGSGKVACAACGGDGRVACAACGGQGKAMGFTANNQYRLLNCSACRGKGQATCGSCSRGRIACTACHGAKKLERWLDVVTWQAQDAQVEPDDYARVFRWSRDGERASRREMEADAYVVGEAAVAGRPLTTAETPDAIPVEEREAVLAAVRAKLQPGERVTRQQLTVLEVPAVAVTYGIGEGQQTIELMGRRLLAPPPGVDTVFRSRARLLSKMAMALAGTPALIGVLYLARGSYYHSAPVAAVVGSVAAAAALVYLVMWHATLGRRSSLKWLAAVPVPLIAAAAFAFLAEPSLADAKAALAKGKLDAALRELGALGRPSDRDLAPTYAEVRFRQLEKATSVADAQRFLALIPGGTPQHQAGIGRLDDMLLAEVRAAFARGQADAAAQRLALGSDALRDNPEVVALQAAADLRRGSACLSKHDWACAFARAGDATARGGGAEAAALRAKTISSLRASIDGLIAAASTASNLESRTANLQAAVDGLTLLEQWTRAEASEPSVELVRLRDRLGKDAAALAARRATVAKREAAERARREAAEARRAAAEARAAERRRLREAAEERRQQRSYRSLMCCDGSTSPSCTCGGSHQGCCSHHGGVCGCE